MSKELISTIIKGREIVYYLTSKSDLEAIKSKSVFADIFLALFSISAGGLLSIYFTKEFSTSLSLELLKTLNATSVLLACFSVVLFVLYVVFTIQSFNAIKAIMASGQINSFNVKSDNEGPNSEKGLTIIEAKYFSNMTSLDVTKEVADRVINNSLKAIANNELKEDPHPGKPKKLKLKYRLDGVVFEKEFNEGDPIQIP